MINEFIEYARQRAPARHQKRFKQDMASWFLQLNEADKKNFVESISLTEDKKARANFQRKDLNLKLDYWQPLAYKMLDIFYKKGAEDGQVGL